VRRLAGEAGADRMTWDAAALAHPLPPTGPRETFLRGELTTVDGRRAVSALANQDSAALSALVLADALIRRRAGAPAAEAGDAVEFLLLRS
jgi:molybdopterin molybdotransferase